MGWDAMQWPDQSRHKGRADAADFASSFSFQSVSLPASQPPAYTSRLFEFLLQASRPPTDLPRSGMTQLSTASGIASLLPTPSPSLLSFLSGQARPGSRGHSSIQVSVPLWILSLSAEMASLPDLVLFALSSASPSVTQPPPPGPK